MEYRDSTRDGRRPRGYQKSPADMREFSTVMVSQGGDSIPANEA